MEWVVFPEPLFALPVADTHAAASSVTLRWDDRFAVDAALGADFPVVEVRSGTWRVSVGVEAVGRMGFFPEPSLRFNLETFDGTFGFPVAVRSGEWSAQLELAHTSAHWADGALAEAGGLPDAVAYSREWLRVLGSRDIGPGRVYGGFRALIHDVRDAEPLATQLGGELIAPWSIAPFVALDLQMAAESGWEPAVAGQVGVVLRTRPGQRFRLAAVGRSGPEDTGRLTGQDEAWLGLTIGFDRSGWLPGSG